MLVVKHSKLKLKTNVELGQGQSFFAFAAQTTSFKLYIFRGYFYLLYLVHRKRNFKSDDSHLHIPLRIFSLVLVYKMAKQSPDFKSTFYIMFKFLDFINIKQRSADLRYDPSQPAYSQLIYEKVYWYYYNIFATPASYKVLKRYLDEGVKIDD